MSELSDLPDDAFADRWRGMRIDERMALSDAEQDEARRRYIKLNPLGRPQYSPGNNGYERKVEPSPEKQKRGPVQFPRVWLDDAQLPTESDYLIKGLIERGKLTLIFGPSGDGKTFFTLDLAGHIAGALAWRGRRVKRGLVVYVAAEAGISILRRFVAWRDRRLSDAREVITPLAIITRAANMLNPLEVGDLMDELRAVAAEAGIPVSLVILDTLSRSMPGGDENKSEDMTGIISSADAIRDELGAGVLLVHHSGKDGSKGARGHSSLFAAADTVISVVERVATVDKSRDGNGGEVFAFGLDVIEMGQDEDGDQITTCIVVPADSAPAPRSKAVLSGAAAVALQALGEVISGKGETLPGTSTIPPGTRAATIDDWRVQFRLRYGSEDGEMTGSTIKKAFGRAREALHKAGRIGVSDPYVWIQA